MELYVYSRGAIERVAPHEVAHVFVSITSALGERARLPMNELTRGVLRLCFLDADAASEHCPEERLFSPAQAESVWAFVEAHRDGLERVVLHCDAGLSRSPAVAAALARVYEGDDAEFFRRYRPNMRVYRALLDAHARRAQGPASGGAAGL